MDEAAFLVLLSYLLRYVPRWVLPDAISSDGYYHLLVAKRIRENGFRLPARIKGLCYPSLFDYPPLFHYLLAFFPPRYYHSLERVISPILDSISVLFFYFSVEAIFGLKGIERFLLTLSLLASPCLIQMGIGPRAFGVTPRTFSELVYGIGTLAWGWAFTSGKPLGYVVSSICLAVVLLSSKFGTQAYLFSYPVIMVCLGVWSGLWIISAGVVLALYISRGHYLSILSGHVGHIRLHNYHRRRDPAPYANSQPWFKLFEAISNASRFRRLHGSIYQIVCLNSISVGFLRNPQIFIVAWISFEMGVPLDPWVRFLLAWMAGGFVGYALTSLNLMAAMGEGYRYLSYAILPSFLLLAWGIQSGWLEFGALKFLLGWNLLLSMFYSMIFIRLNWKPDTFWRANGELNQFLQRLNFPLRILPVNEASYSLAYRSNREIFYPGGNYALHFIRPDEYRWIYSSTVNIHAERSTEIGRKYGLNLVVVRKEYTGPDSMQHFLKSNKIIFENSGYLIVEIHPA